VEELVSPKVVIELVVEYVVVDLPVVMSGSEKEIQIFRERLNLKIKKQKIENNKIYLTVGTLPESNRK